MNHQTEISLRKIGQGFNVHRKTNQRELNETGIRYRKKKIEEVPTHARRFYRTLLKDDFELIIDDEN